MTTPIDDEAIQKLQQQGNFFVLPEYDVFQKELNALTVLQGGSADRIHDVIAPHGGSTMTPFQFALIVVEGIDDALKSAMSEYDQTYTKPMSDFQRQSFQALYLAHAFKYVAFIPDEKSQEEYTAYIKILIDRTRID